MRSGNTVDNGNCIVFGVYGGEVEFYLLLALPVKLFKSYIFIEVHFTQFFLHVALDR